MLLSRLRAEMKLVEQLEEVAETENVDKDMVKVAAKELLLDELVVGEVEQEAEEVVESVEELEVERKVDMEEGAGINEDADTDLKVAKVSLLAMAGSHSGTTSASPLTLRHFNLCYGIWSSFLHFVLIVYTSKILQTLCSFQNVQIVRQRYTRIK